MSRLDPPEPLVDKPERHKMELSCGLPPSLYKVHMTKLQIALKSEALRDREKELEKRERDLAVKEIEIEYKRCLLELEARAHT